MGRLSIAHLNSVLRLTRCGPIGAWLHCRRAPIGTWPARVRVACWESPLTSRLRWGVVTNKSARFTEPLTRSIPLFATAGAVVSGDTTPFSKPHPASLLEAARRIGVLPAECVYIGDDERDIVAGRAAGMRAIAATYGYMGAKADVKDWGADAAIESPSRLLQCLKLA